MVVYHTGEIDKKRKDKVIQAQILKLRHYDYDF